MVLVLFAFWLLLMDHLLFGGRFSKNPVMLLKIVARSNYHENTHKYFFVSYVGQVCAEMVRRT